MSSIPLVNLRKERAFLGEEMDAAVSGVMDRGEFIMGREVRELEERLREYCGAKYCVAVSSGTDALLLGLMALGIGRGDEVITTPFSWVSTAEVIAFLGATVVFADIDPTTYLIDPTSVKSSLSDKTKAVIPVSLFGRMADLDAIRKVVGDIPIIEDGAQSFGAQINNRYSCADSIIGTTSFFPTKPLACYGDGGAVFTSDGDVAASVRSLRVHGKDGVTKMFSSVGLNARLDTMQAAILLVKMKHFDKLLDGRINAAERYNKMLGGIEGVEVPVAPEGYKHVYGVYTIRFPGREDRRDAVKQSLAENGIGHAIYYDRSIHQQPAYAPFAAGASLKIAEEVGTEVISLPMDPYLTAEEQERIVGVIRSAVSAL